MPFNMYKHIAYENFGELSINSIQEIHQIQYSCLGNPMDRGA